MRLAPHGMELPKVAPGTKVTVGRPLDAQPFIQVRLLEGRRYEAKSGRSWSYVPRGGAALPRGTQRTFAQATAAALQWSWAFFRSLPAAKQEELRTKYGEQNAPDEMAGAPEVDVPRPAKRARNA